MEPMETNGGRREGGFTRLPLLPAGLLLIVVVEEVGFCDDDDDGGEKELVVDFEVVDNVDVDIVDGGEGAGAVVEVSLSVVMMVDDEGAVLEEEDDVELVAVLLLLLLLLWLLEEEEEDDDDVVMVVVGELGGEHEEGALLSP